MSSKSAEVSKREVETARKAAIETERRAARVEEDRARMAENARWFAFLDAAVPQFKGRSFEQFQTLGGVQAARAAYQASLKG